ncbi:2-hydroxyacid dehydrogenase [Planctomycetota bacterium]|nr:2-hydroxyacid dehydrogenase [Planctomycetota bacterium]
MGQLTVKSNLGSEQIELLRALLVGVDLLGPDDAGDFEILIAGRPSRKQLEASTALQTLIIPFAGLPKVTADLMRDFPHIAVHNLHHNAAATAEIAVTLLLSVAKSVVPIDANLRNADWSDRGQGELALQLDGRTALILGYGHIGKRVARACHGLGMSTLAVGRTARSIDGVDVQSITQLNELLPKADALMICLPATEETEGLIGESELALLPKTAVVVNIARGSILDEAALFDALKDKRIFGAGLDVWWNYPASAEARSNTPPANLPFHELPNVVMSPHRGGHVTDTEDQRMRGLAEMLNAAADGETIPNRVNLDAGY